MMTFSFYFFLLTMSLAFWGRHILKFLNIDQGPKPQIMLRLTAALAVMVVISHGVRQLGYYLGTYLTVFYLVGLLGALLEFYGKNLRPWLKDDNKWPAIKKGLASRDSIIAAMILALSMSLVYSAISPTGKFDGWVNTGADFYSWIFQSHYHLGLIDPGNPELSPFFMAFEMDAFGTYVTIALTALARAQLPYEAASAIVVTFIVWLGLAVYVLVRQVFRFSFFLTLAVCLSLCLGSILNYVAMTGMFGHLVFLFVFIISLTQIFSYEFNNFKFINIVKHIFFPLFLLFLSYQAGYGLLLSFIVLSISLVSFFTFKLPMRARILRSLWLGLGPVLMVSAICVLLQPGVGYYLFYRTIEVSYQSAGWALPLFNPLLFSGLPFYLSTNQFNFNVQYNDISIFSYLIFISIILLLATGIYFFCNRSNNKNNLYIYLFRNENNKIFILILSSIYIITIIFYLLLFYLYGNTYKIWKFSAYTSIPLSFIPTSLVLCALCLARPRRFPQLPCLVVLATALIFAVSFLKLPAFIKMPQAYFRYSPSSLFLSSLYEINLKFDKSTTFIIDFSEQSLNFLSSLVYSKTNHKLLYKNNVIFFKYNTNYFDVLFNNTIILSNILYDGIINSNKYSINTYFGSSYIYTLSDLIKNGYVAFHSSQTFDWQITDTPVYFRFIVPAKMIGQDLNFAFTPSPGQPSSPGCGKVWLGLVGDDRRLASWNEKDMAHPTMAIPASLNATGRLEIAAKASPGPDGEKCAVNIDKVDLSLPSGDGI
jgi:hypothetical protein